MIMTLTHKEVRHALIAALEKKYPEQGVLGHQAIEIEVFEVDKPEDIALEAKRVVA
jgi:hypothetical protein